MSAVDARPLLVERIDGTAPAGLVICAKSRRKSTTRAFPPPDLVGMAAATLAASAAAPRWDGSEGPRWFASISPGSVRISSKDLARGQRALEREVTTREKLVAQRVDFERAGLDWVEPAVGRSITQWSAKSRANMVRRLMTLDYAQLDRPVLTTVTYPGEWLSVAPTAKDVKRHLDLFRKRFKRAFGICLRCVWKQEFQSRGAPHFHLLHSRPEVDAQGNPVSLKDFRLWVAQAWSACIDHQDPEHRRRGLMSGTGVDAYEGERMTDPKRVAIYFSKHGMLSAKDYQNRPPAAWDGQSIGRMWGYWGFEPLEVAAPISGDQAVALSRTLRRWQHHQRYLRPVQVWRVEQATGRIRKRTVRRPVRRMRGTAGFLGVNDGPSVAMMLDRILTANPTAQGAK